MMRQDTNPFSSLTRMDKLAIALVECNLRVRINKVGILSLGIRTSDKTVLRHTRDMSVPHKNITNATRTICEFHMVREPDVILFCNKFIPLCPKRRGVLEACLAYASSNDPTEMADLYFKVSGEQTKADSI